MKVLSAAQIRQADQFTIENEPIASIDLMERASEAFVAKFLEIVKDRKPLIIFCGTGNNGGDGLAIGRILDGKGWEVKWYVIGDPEKGSDDFKANLSRILEYEQIRSKSDFPKLNSADIVIDGIFGSGLSRPVEGLFKELILHINEGESQNVAIDISSGLFADEAVGAEHVAIEADYTISFQTPKWTFFQPESNEFVGDWKVVDIGLDQGVIDSLDTDYELSEESELRKLVPVRSRFMHKSKVGRLFLIAGSKGKMGAAALSAKAALRTGVGLIEVHTAKCGTEILQSLVPEAMVLEDKGEEVIESIEAKDATVAIGPGIGTDPKTAETFRKLLSSFSVPLVIDADGINLIANDTELLKKLPKESILTPHPGEFKRLVGDWDDDRDKLDKLIDLSRKYQVNVVLKGAYSAVCNSEGKIYFSPTGNPGMATAGSGDVLTGMIASLLAQGLQPFDALRLGVYLHGLAGDLAAQSVGEHSLIASDIIDHLPAAFLSCHPVK